MVHYCAHVTRDIEVAEDLAQETLLTAWRDADKLRDTDRREQWLFGIARNLCLHWLRSQRRDTAYLLSSHAVDQEDDLLVEEVDIEVELERKELADLLDRALALLPEETRTVLIQHYIEESPLSEIAVRLHTSSGALAMRLQRGRLFLRRLFTHELRQEMLPYHQRTAADDWERTPIWCHSCGQQRLLGKRTPSEGRLLLKCPTCHPDPDELFNHNHLAALKGIHSYKPLYARLAAWCDRYYRGALEQGTTICEYCGATIRALITTPEQFPNWLRAREEMQMWSRYRFENVVLVPCAQCGSASITTLEGLVLQTPQGQKFMRAHPRLRTLPRQEIEVAGRPALLSRFESVTDTAVFTVISDAATYRLLAVYGEDDHE
ncbi:RNA polymerase sigma factor [Dictyobacter aurantiacus]|uniref:RNA polymerase sigma factor n=1 Tax=Dictyobacter aurantiacus TaxID=1936993 RepID=A0A401ZN10_9CHLR|nr:RNA polymerase sigma factor [Dictyobacter aurantiacus]GCE08245.1 hypothetical protein KDAU_55740 [Dictyobacter aurantiacus]